MRQIYYYKMRQLFYYKRRQKFVAKCVWFLLQNATDLLQNVTVTTKYDVYYKWRLWIVSYLLTLMPSSHQPTRLFTSAKTQKMILI